MAHRRASFFALTTILTISAGSAFAQGEPVVERLQHGEVNWTDKTVMATGSGAPNLKLPNVAAIRLNAERSAELSAYKNVLEALKGVRISAQTLGGDQLGKQQIKAQVEGIVRGCKKVDTRYFSDYGVDVVVKCPLDGALASVLSPQSEFKPIEVKGEKSITGLIVDATDLGLKPTLAPRLVAEDGTEVYSQSLVKPASLQKSGVVAYYSSVDLAKKSERVGGQPLVVKAIGLAEDSGEIRIASADAAKIKAANLYFLTEGRVAVATEGP
jgi:hypothetical protein